MIERIEGVVREVTESGFTMTAGALTVQLLASRTLLASVSAGKHVSLPAFFQLQIEGNRIVPVLIAFANELERELFEAFLTVSGIGPRAAVKAMTRPVEEIVPAIASGDEKFLSTLPGIGKAKAKQIVASLQDRFSKSAVASGGSSSVSHGQSAARVILLQLGLSGAEADALLARAVQSLGDGAADSEVVREAMRLRSRR